MRGYRITASDGEIGHLEDYIIDDNEWLVRYLVVDTTNWLPGKQVLIPREWTSRTSWSEQVLHVNVTREQAESAPAFEPDKMINRQVEERSSLRWCHRRCRPAGAAAASPERRSLRTRRRGSLDR